MHISYIKKCIKNIDEAEEDSEWKHVFEKKLILQVLQFIASGDCKNPQKYAEEVLKVTALDFARWYA